jgi:hypothetical protein
MRLATTIMTFSLATPTITLAETAPNGQDEQGSSLPLRLR